MAQTNRPGNEEKVSYKDTLNLPQTAFPIRPNHAVDDPALIARWEREKLFHESSMHNEGNEKFILHDGPPYANGHIHLGHAYNKILKDIACKARRMSGMHVPVIPGWDCHGLPIELKVSQEFPGLSSDALIKECRSYAQKWIDIQREEFKQLGVLMDWDHPYLTMDHRYEAQILRAFGEFVQKGFIQKKGKTVPWCPSCQTVLAAAEIEHKDRKDPSIYVKFSLSAEDIAQSMPSSLHGKSVSLLVWTTTPWTLPLNRAVILKPDAQYAVLDVEKEYIVVGEPLADAIASLLGREKKIVVTISAEQLSGRLVRHPFIENLAVPIILDQSVSLSDGTAAVHCAPGCGPEDYEIAIKNNLEIFSPISADGKYAYGIEPHELEGMSVADGQIWVLKKLTEKGTLLLKKSITHSYPHCWRCRGGLIFRATKQWFLDLSQHNLRQQALDAVQTITFLPEKASNFLKATIAGRLEWCISRQRVWGVPIPALLCKQCDYAFINKEFIMKAAEQVQEKGIEYWRQASVSDLAKSVQCPQCFNTDFAKEQDILDVWFESGVSHFAVLYKNPAAGFPADLYLEGIDQHRAWFQSSLLTSLVLEGQSCTKAILSHGFTVDEKGHKMSKSLGNVVTPTEIIEKVGTDGLRLWASSVDYDGDAIVSDVLLRNVAEVYRKMRNTARFLLSNLNDFDKEKDEIALSKMLLIDRYALEQLFHVNYRIRKAYLTYNFTAVFHELAEYCTTELSSFYLDVIKDRLYVEKADGIMRRSAQTACWYILDTLTRAIAPILSFTAEQISDMYQPNKLTSIHLQPFADLTDVWNMMISRSPVDAQSAIDWYPLKGGVVDAADAIKKMAFHAERTAQWEILLAIRSVILKELELLREKGIIKHSLEAQVTLYIDFSDKDMEKLRNFFAPLDQSVQSKEEFFKEFFIVSQYHRAKSKEGLKHSEELPGLWLNIARAAGEKCPRCWQWDISDHPDNLCRRCQQILAQ